MLEVSYKIAGMHKISNITDELLPKNFRINYHYW